MTPGTWPVAIVGAFLWAYAATASAQEDKDLSFLPPPAAPAQSAQGADASGPPPAQAPASSAPTGGDRHRIFLEDDVSWISDRSGSPLLAGPTPRPWLNRASLDLSFDAATGDGLHFSVSDRFSFSQTEGASFSDQSTHNDLREIYVGWSPTPADEVQAGRINVHNGVAIGFSPTDYFRAGSMVLLASSDPTVARASRLGVVMGRYDHNWDDFSVTAAFAPRLQDARTGPRPPLDLALDQTNIADRWLLTFNFKLADTSPQLLVFDDGQTTFLGASASHLLSDSTVVYAEWSGGRRSSLFDLARGVSGEAFRSDLSIGGSWSHAALGLTVNAEYHYHGAGLSRSEMATLTSPGHSVALAQAEDEASFQQDPLTRQEIFTRVQLQDRFAKGLTLALITVTDIGDLSSFVNLSAAYNVSDRWTLAGYYSADAGPPHTEYGVLPTGQTVTLQLIRYF